MEKQRRKFETGFKQQIVSEVALGLLSVSAASRMPVPAAFIKLDWAREVAA